MENTSCSESGPQDLGDLRHKVVLVTGASSGLGREFCLSFAQHGCRVIAVARRTNLLQTLIEEIRCLRETHSIDLQQPRPGEAVAFQIDISASEQEIDAAVEKAWQIFGRIDVLVNNAGVRGTTKSCLDMDIEEWNQVMATNLRGSWLMSKAVGKRMQAAMSAGSVINISSVAGLDRSVYQGTLAYSCSKAAVNQLTKVMASELGKYNIRVNAIAAGIFKSEITEGLLEKPWVHKVAQKVVPTQRWGVVNPDLTSLVSLLASSSSSYITGCIFIVDGGYSLSGVPVWSSL